MFLHRLKNKPQQDPLRLALQCLAFIIIRSVSGLIVPGTDGNSVCVIHDLLPKVPPDGESCTCSLMELVKLTNSAVN